MIEAGPDRDQLGLSQDEIRTRAPRKTMAFQGTLFPGTNHPSTVPPVLIRAKPLTAPDSPQLPLVIFQYGVRHKRAPSPSLQR